ncbi:MAG: DUF5106 domain-containing protein, partial [Muribaculaceae bacterium]|nr:DUF5106 domain-containing protein [Muribaculaceae bacterium]
IPPLFEYPVAPEELPSMMEKSDYIVEHFWDNFDFKSKKTVDQNALNHAFGVFSTAMRFADADKTVLANKRLISTLSKNPILMLQFTKAAEENIYGPRADFWIDDIYLMYVDAILSNKKISQDRKKKYESQKKIIGNSRIGQSAPKFSFIRPDGSSANYFPMSTPTLIIFGNPSDTDWRMARLKMESNLNLIKAIDKGQVSILFIVPEVVDGWESKVDNYSSKWTVGASGDISMIYDTRVSPSAYVIGSDGNIVSKNTSLPIAIATLLDQIKE